jgi:hypothetical protein
MTSYEGQETLNQRLPVEITKLAQRNIPNQVAWLIGVATGAAKRAFARNLDGEKGPFPAENLSPNRDNFRVFHLGHLRVNQGHRGLPETAEHHQHV